MRRFARTSVMASTAVLAAAIGAVSFAPFAGAQEEEPPVGLLGSGIAETPDLVVSIAAVCDTTVKDAPEGGFVALQVKVLNDSPDAAGNVTTNYAALPGIQASNFAETIAPGKDVTYTVPSVDREWIARPAGAATFSSQLDANFLNNITGTLLSHSCIPAPVEEPAE